mmetsp:Transcript_54379/g.65451  ORF Transcript_54379/g.65451 Transcript_54379/m.65451 type:complete len:93 (+) Transcript_54379:664-942(+)
MRSLNLYKPLNCDTRYNYLHLVLESTQLLYDSSLNDLVLLLFADNISCNFHLCPFHNTRNNNYQRQQQTLLLEMEFSENNLQQQPYCKMQLL